MNNLAILTPEFFLATIALIVLLGDAFSSNKRLWYVVSLVSLIATAAYLMSFFCSKQFPGIASLGVTPASAEGLAIAYAPLFNMILVDSVAVFFKIAIVISVIIVVWLSRDYHEFGQIEMGTYCGLLLLATVGMMLLVSSSDLLMAIVALELLSVTSFILTGFAMKRRSSSEAAMKFFLVGSLSTGIYLFGASYYYGYFGTTSLMPLFRFAETGQSPDLALNLLLTFLIGGLGFKLAMVPFHQWAPDTYEGAPTPITAFLSVAPKAAAVGFVLRLVGHHEALGLTSLLAGLAAVTMTVGNVGALQQTNIKRLLAYSSIAQVGYILVALVAGGTLGMEAALLYTFIYLFMNLGVFTIAIAVSNVTKSDEIASFAGLSRRSFGLAALLVIFLLSMSGIPPLAGFIGKFTIFAAVIRKSGLLWLGIIAVINSVISVYYYFRIAHQMFFRDPDGSTPTLKLSPALISSLVVAMSVTLVAGLLPNHLLAWVRNLLGS